MTWWSTTTARRFPAPASPRWRGRATRGRRPAALAPARERARRVPVHRRRLPVQAHAGGPDADVRRRGAGRAHQPALPPTSPTASRRSACRPPSTRSRSTARTPAGAPTSTARSARAASRCSPSRRPSSSTPASTSATRRPSVSMTINGPAPTILAFFLNTAIRQQARQLPAPSRGGWRSRRSSASSPTPSRGAQLGGGARAARRRRVRAASPPTR